MNWYWPLAVLILGVLLFSYCTYTANKAGRSLDSGLDSLDNQACYQAGYNAAFAGRSEAPTSGVGEECARWLTLASQTAGVFTTRTRNRSTKDPRPLHKRNVTHTFIAPPGRDVNSRCTMDRCAFCPRPAPGNWALTACAGDPADAASWRREILPLCPRCNRLIGSREGGARAEGDGRALVRGSHSRALRKLVRKARECRGLSRGGPHSPW